MSEILALQKKDKKELLEETNRKVFLHQEKCHAFVTILERLEPNQTSSSLLANIPYVLKDNISTKGILTTGSSNSLKDYIPPYDATVYQKLCEKGALCVAKSVMDEFGMGATGTTGHTGNVLNPWDETRISGGSSAGSATAVADGVVPFAIGTDTGDSIRKPAAFNGIVGYKPTYGMISRYGMFPFASSLDHVGVLTRYVEDAAIVVNEIKGKDVHDMTSWNSSDIDLLIHLKDSVKGKKLFTIHELVDIEEYPNPSEDLKFVLEEFHKTVDQLKELGLEVETVSIPHELLNALLSTYLCISCAEATSNMSNLTGIIFGPRGNGQNINEVMMDHRSTGFSPLIKRRFVIGSYVLQKENQAKYFENACRIRNRIVRIMKNFFQEYDALILPCSSSIAPKIDEVSNEINESVAALENHMCIGNFGGFPSITIPSGFLRNMPLGINLTSEVKKDALLLNIAYQIENIFPFKGQVAKKEEER